MAAITLLVNGKKHTVDVDPSTPLLYVLRNDLDLSGPQSDETIAAIRVTPPRFSTCKPLAMPL